MNLQLPALFGAGLLTFASPCILPLVPIYAATLAGTSFRELREGRAVRRRALLATTAFALGLGAVFVALGMAATSIARLLGSHRQPVVWASAALLALFGLRALGLIRLPWLERTTQPLLRRLGAGGSVAGSFLFGAAFALGWTPCVGPVLASVLTYTASATASPARGAVYLAAYAAGIAAPLFALALFAPAVLRVLERGQRHVRTVEIATGVLLLGAAAVVAHGAWVGSSSGGAAAVASGAPFTPAPEASAGAQCAASTGCGLPALTSAPVAPPAFTPAAPAAASTGGSVIVEFVSTSCPVCHAMEPVVREFQRTCGVVKVERRVVEAPGGMDAAARLGIRAVPTFVVLGPDGQEQQRLLGMQPLSALRAAAEAASGARCAG